MLDGDAKLTSLWLVYFIKFVVVSGFPSETWFDSTKKQTNKNICVYSMCSVTTGQPQRDKDIRILAKNKRMKQYSNAMFVTYSNNLTLI